VSHCELLHESLAKRGLTFLWGEVLTRGAGRHPCCCVNRSTRQRRERQWRKERHQIDSPCLVNDFLHIYLLSYICTHPSHPHTYLPCHTLLPSHLHTCTHTYHATPSYPHTFTPARIPTMPHSPTLTPSHLHISPPHPSQSWVFLISLRLKLKVTKVTWRRRRMSVPSA